MSAATATAPVKKGHHPLKSLKAKIVTLIFLAVFVHFGTFIVSGLYYLCFEIYKPFTDGWHELVSDSYTRHMIRDVGEGLLGGYLAQMVVWNHFKRSVAKTKDRKPNLFDKLEFKLHIPNMKNRERLSALQYLSAPVLGIIYAIPGFVISYYAIKAIHLHTTGAPVGSYWEKVQAIWKGAWDHKVVGLFSSFIIGRRPMKKVYDELQLWFVERRLIAGKKLRWYQPPTFKARYEDAQTWFHPSQVGDLHEGAVNTVLTAAVVIGVCLAGFGYYVLTVIA